MSKRDIKNFKANLKLDTEENETFIQNLAPFIGWANFDIFWSQVVKGKGSPTIKSACQAHLKALGVWEDQSKWIDALIDFGIPIEK